MRRISKFPSGPGEVLADGGRPERERPGACYPLKVSAASTSTSNENASAIDPEGPMKLLLVKSERWKPTLTLPATAGLRDLVGWEKAVRRRMKARFGAKIPKGWLPALSDSIPSILFP